MKYTYQTTNKKLINMLFNLAKEKGYEICKNYQHSVDTPDKEVYWQYFVVDLLEMEITGTGLQGDKIDLEKLVDLLTGDQIVKLELNKEYTAIVNYTTNEISVGCQKFGFKKIKELAKLLNK